MERYWQTGYGGGHYMEFGSDETAGSKFNCP